MPSTLQSSKAHMTTTGITLERHETMELGFTVPQKPKMPPTQYLGSKERLVPWILSVAPEDVDCVFDAFSGTSVVGCHFKLRGAQVFSNDIMKANYHTARALVENSTETLSDADVERSFRENPSRGGLMERLFTGVFFERDQAVILDNSRANVERFEGHKKSLAFAVMCRALTRKVTVGHFTHLQALNYSKDPERVRRNPNLARPLRDIFEELIPLYNQAVFDNGRRNRAFCENTLGPVGRLREVDLAYFDPPYVGRHPDYQAFYHLWETFVEYWQDKEFRSGTRMYYPRRKSGFVLKSEIVGSLERLFQLCDDIPYWLISYNRNLPTNGPGGRRLVRLGIPAGRADRRAARDWRLFGCPQRHAPENEDSKNEDPSVQHRRT
jgi:adenine-specific DNA-methyltransferase